MRGRVCSVILVITSRVDIYSYLVPGRFLDEKTWTGRVEVLVLCFFFFLKYNPAFF